MRDALGGSVNIVIIVVFIVIALGYMAFNVNYTKAFRMKNKIISLYEEYNGVCNTNCKNDIKTYAHQIGYNPENITCPDGYKNIEKIYCVKEVNAGKPVSSSIHKDKKTQYYFKVITKINIEIPIISNIFDLNLFNVTGDTKMLTKE